MARAIIRYSFDGAEGKAIRTEIRKRLSINFESHGTASWESRPGTPLADVLSDVQWALACVQERLAGNPAALDHIWIYIDEHTE